MQTLQPAFAGHMPPNPNRPAVSQADPSQASQRLLDHGPQKKAMLALSAISDKLGRLNHCADVDLGEAIDLLKMVKWAQSDGHLECLPRDDEVMVALVCRLALLLRRFSLAVMEGQLPLNGMGLEGIHDMCNGLSACFGADQANCLFSATQIDQIAGALAGLNQALVTQALKKGLPKGIHSNGMLLDVLNWQSRGLKQKLFSSEDQQIRQLFQESLKLMHQWVSPDGKGMPGTHIDVMDTRQLGKCMVQLNTMLKQGVLDLDVATPEGIANRKLLGETALGLCGGLAAGFRAWRRVGNDNSSSARSELESVAVDGVVVTNIANTVNDFLAAGLIAPSAAALPGIAGQLSAWMDAIAQAQLYDRG